ncbi:TIF3 [Candida margitis]|uniref:TIF3 n=1 Tax=Candida margitis TaxID=1775924 RepID=UPI0022277FBE|nr:TIF3 [Candida margitis]KAI5969815.1 TIF3 [Candida margitis]
MGPKKNVKMDLGSFLADDAYGGTSWADEEVDLNSIGLSLDKSTTEAPIGGRPAFSGLGGGESGGFQEQRRERKEYPIPDKPPYVARVSNLPWEVTEEVIVRHFEDRMQAQDIITDVKLPVDRDNGRLKGYAFITFTERGILEESLQLTLSEFQGRKIFVNVAAPPRADEGDWRSGRSGPLGGGREPEVELDWGSARRAQADLPRRERSNRGPREDRPSGPDLDWGAARSESSGLPPRERSHRGPREHKPRDEPDLDWGAARTEAGKLPPRERSHRAPREHTPRDEPELDWGAARSTHAELPPRQKSSRTSSHGEGQEHGSFNRTPRRQEPDLDWGAARSTAGTLPPRERSHRSGSNRKTSESDFDWKRGQPLQQRTKSTSHGNKNKDDKKEEDKPQGPQKSQFSVLSVDDGDDDDNEEEQQQPEAKQESGSDDVSKLASATANLSVSEKNSSNEDWEVVGKK